MNVEMAYLLGMITGNGEIQRGATETTVSIDIPHKKLETEFQNDVGIYGLPVTLGSGFTAKAMATDGTSVCILADNGSTVQKAVAKIE